MGPPSTAFAMPRRGARRRAAHHPYQQLPGTHTSLAVHALAFDVAPFESGFPAPPIQTVLGSSHLLLSYADYATVAVPLATELGEVAPLSPVAIVAIGVVGIVPFVWATYEVRLRSCGHERPHREVRIE